MRLRLSICLLLAGLLLVVSPLASAQDSASERKQIVERLALKRGELAVFSWILYSSKAHRDRVNAKVMKDPVITRMMKTRKMPFDMKRMSYGGFEAVVDL
jgi:uncharacterized protein YbaA (DUF1428 family)